VRWLTSEQLTLAEVTTQVLLRFLAWCREATYRGRPGGNVYAITDQQTGTSRATLYRRRELRALIDTYRDPTGDALTVTTLATHIDQLRHTLDAVAAKVRRHEEELRSLKHHARTEHAS
jgi:hypothetical protein